jgi:hypothetical protein
MAGGQTNTPDAPQLDSAQQVAQLAAGLFEAELVRFFAAQPYRETAHRLNDPGLLQALETQLRQALARWTEEGVVGLSAVHLSRVHSPAAERQWQSESDAAQEQARLEREHRLRLLAARQAAELAQVQPPITAPPAPQALAPAAQPARLASPRVSRAEDRQAAIERVLGGLASAQPEAVRVRLFAWAGNRSAGVAESVAANPGGISTLNLGDEIHVVIDSSFGGYLHVFNLGSSGEVTPIVPEPRQLPVRIEPGVGYLISTGAAIVPVSSEPPPLSPWVEQGPVNGFPERLLAVVTAEPIRLTPSDLHPAWGGAESLAQPARPEAALHLAGFGIARVETTLSGRPTAGWAWGVAEAAVVV